MLASCLSHLHAERKASAALAVLVAVAVLKTLLTKVVFVHVGLPVAFSIQSCVATAICILPILLLTKPPQAEGGAEPLPARATAFAWPARTTLPGLLAVSVAIGVDLACTNVALHLLSVALQQSIKAASPAVTLLIESAYHRKRQHPLLRLVVALLCVGPILTKLGSSSLDASFFGVVMMAAAVVTGGFKYVFAHAAIKEYKRELGTAHSDGVGASPNLCLFCLTRVSPAKL
jgi:drug/metabolite transporter (DMT)-like permease